MKKGAIWDGPLAEKLAMLKGYVTPSEILDELIALMDNAQLEGYLDRIISGYGIVKGESMDKEGWMKSVKKSLGDSFTDADGSVMYVDLNGGYNFKIVPEGGQFKLVFYNGGYLGGDEVDMGTFPTVGDAKDQADALGERFVAYYASTKKSKVKKDISALLNAYDSLSEEEKDRLQSGLDELCTGFSVRALLAGDYAPDSDGYEASTKKSKVKKTLTHMIPFDGDYKEFPQSFKCGPMDIEFQGSVAGAVEYQGWLSYMGDAIWGNLNMDIDMDTGEYTVFLDYGVDGDEDGKTKEYNGTVGGFTSLHLQKEIGDMVWNDYQSLTSGLKNASTKKSKKDVPMSDTFAKSSEHTSISKQIDAIRNNTYDKIGKVKKQ